MGCGSALARARPRVPPRAHCVSHRASRARAARIPFSSASRDDPSVVSPWLTRTTPSVPSGRFADASSAEEAASAAEDELRDTVRPFLESNPGVVVARVARVTLAGARVILTWVFKSPDRGEILRDAVASLGPVYVKLGQTLASREDLIGVEASAALRTLQDRMPPFEADAALDLLRAELHVHPDVPLAHPADPRAPFARLSREPVAAASLAQVHKGILRDGRVVAVKIQRPGVYEQVALDMYVFRLLLAGLRAYWKTDTDIPAVADEVGAGLLRELDFRLEAANAGDFARRNGAVTPFLRVPRGVPELSARRVMTTEWIDGKPLRECDADQRLALVRMGLTSSVAQMFQTGTLHADPHEGNFLLANDGRLAMLDFGLVTRMDPSHQEAMAGCVLAFVAEDYDAMLDNFAGMGVIPDQPQRWVDGRWVDCSRDEFADAFKAALFAADSRENDKNGEPFRPTDMTDFGSLWVRLGALALEYAFLLPSYYALVMRSFATFEGIAKSIDGEFDVYAAAIPFAARRALAPVTPEGRDALRRALVDERGALRVGRLVAMARTPAEHRTRRDVANNRERDERREGEGEGEETSTAAASAAFSAVSALLLEERDGRALRRVLREADSIAAAKALLTRDGFAALRVAAEASTSASTSAEDTNRRPGYASASIWAPEEAEMASAMARRRAPARRKRVLAAVAGAHARRLLHTEGFPGVAALVALGLAWAWARARAWLAACARRARARMSREASR